MLWALLVALLLPALAQASTIDVRPDATVRADGWRVSVTESTDLHTALDDAVTAPTVPSALDDYIFSSSKGAQVADIHFAGAPLRTDESITAVSLLSYITPASGWPLTVDLRIGGQTIALGNIPGGAVAGWYRMDVPGTLSASQLDIAHVRFSLEGRGSTTAARVGVAYLRVQTDVAPPAATITSSPRSPSSSRAPQWSFTGTGGTRFECRLLRGATVISGPSTCTSPAPSDLGGQPDGTYTFGVTNVDGAGLRSAETTSAYVLDTTPPPAPALTAAPASPGQAASVSWAWTAEEGAAAQCRLERGASVVQDWAACASPSAHTLTTDGSHTFRVRATDAAGNTSAETTSTYVLDRAAPASPSITSGPALATSSTTASYAFTAEGGATTQCRLERGATLVQDWAACASPKGHTLTTDGTHTFRVRATDAAGNTGTEATWSHTLDRVAPAAPSITAGPATPSRTTAPSFSFSGEAGGGFACQLERAGVVLEAFTACTSPRGYDVAAEADGTFTFRVHQTDAAGNTSAVASRSYVLDRTPPAAPTITSAPPAETSSTSASVGFSVEGGATTQCRLEQGATLVQDWAACASPWTSTLTTDGSHTFRVRATDAAGNTGPEATATWTLDRAPPPDPVITAAPADPTSSATPSWSFTVADGASAECRLVRGTTTVSGYAACTSPRTYDLAGAPDGAYTFEVRARDAAGNRSAAAGSTVTVDRTAPAPPSFTTAPPSPSADDTPTWAFEHEAGATATCRLLRDGTATSAFASCSSPETRDVSALADGTITLEVRATDTAGNAGAVAASSFVLDRAAPAAPVITGGPGPASSDDTPELTWTAEAGATSLCAVLRGVVVVRAEAVCTSPSALDLTAEPDGDYTLTVLARDAAGNRSLAASLTWTLDRTAPDAPRITGAPAAQSPDATPTWTFEPPPQDPTLDCRLDGPGVTGTWAPCTGSFEPAELAQDGTWTFSVRATDPATNTGPSATSSYVLDRVAPGVPEITGGPPAASPDDTPTWTFTADAGALPECRLRRGPDVVADWAACASPAGFSPTAPADGTWSFDVRARDLAGNVGGTATASYVLDRVAPEAPVLATWPQDPTTDDTPTWTFTAEDGAAAACRLERDTAVVQDWVACASPHTLDLRGAPDGAYTFRVRATDAAGLTSPATSRAFTLDRGAPDAPGITTRPAADTSDPVATWAWTAEAGTRTECRLQRTSDDTEVMAWSACDGSLVRDLGASDGTYAFSVRAVDDAGNTGAAATASHRLDRVAPAAPVLTEHPPAAGRVASVTWAFTAEDGAALECRLTAPGAAVGAYAPCSSPVTAELDADGTWAFEARATDAAGNTGEAVAVAYALDRLAPGAPVFTAGPAAESADDVPTWAFTAEDGAALACRLERDDVVVEPWAPCLSPHTVDNRARSDGRYALLVQATDAAGNAGSVATRAYRLDREAPAAPVLGEVPASPTATSSLSWAWTGEAGAGFECRLDRGTEEVRAWSPCTSPEAASLAGEPDGTYRFAVRAVDPAGNLGAAATHDVRLDRTAPDAPTFTTAPPADTGSSSLTWAWTAEPGATARCELRRDGAVLDAAAACTSPLTRDVAAQPDGLYALTVRVTDAVGNTSAAATSSTRVDRAAPAAPTFSSAPPAVGNDPTLEWTFAAEAGTVLRCLLERDGVPVVGPATCTSPYAAELAAAPDGTYRLLVTATDAAGNESAPGERTTVLDRVAPAAPVLADGPPPDTADDTPSWTATAEPATTLQCVLERDGWALAPWAACPDPLAYDLGAEPDGAYTLRVRAVDLADNVGEEAADSFRLDRTTPATPSFDAEPGEAGTDASPTWAFSTAEADRTLECRLHGPEDGGAWAACASPLTPALATDGTYRLEVRAVSAAGARSSAIASTYALDRVAPAAPTVTGGPQGPTRTATPAFTFSTEAGTDLECRLGVAWEACGTTYEPVLTEDGPYTLRVRATDAAGNTSQEATRSFELDRVAPAAPTITGGPAGPTNDATPAFTVEGEGTLACTLDGTWKACGPTFEPVLTEDGPRTLRVRATDAAGNVSEEATRAFSLDRTAPAAPALGGPSGPTNDATPTFSVDGEGTLECTLGDGWLPCGPTYEPTLRSDGPYTLRARATDAAGNTSEHATRELVLDRTPPPAPVLTAGPGAATTDTTPTWAFSLATDATARCRLDGPRGLGTWSACTSPHTATLDADGTWTLHVRAVDAAGNLSEPVASTVELDRTVPAVPAFTSTPPAAGRDPELAFAFATSEPGRTFECRAVRPGDAGTWAACTSPHTTTAGQDGTYGLDVRAVSKAGARSEAVSARALVDRVAPGAPAVSGGPPARSPDPTPAWTVTGEAGAALSCRVQREDQVLRDWAPCGSPTTFDARALPDGPLALHARAADAAGNASTTAVAGYVLDRTVPGAVVFTQRPADQTTDTTPTWAFTADGDGTSECRLLRGDAVLAGWATCTSPHTAELPTDGAYRLEVRRRNEAGTAGPTSADELVLDTSAPDAPQLTAAPAAVGNASVLRWAFAAEPGASATCRVVLDGRELRPWAPCTSPVVHDLGGEPDGVVVLEVRATDAAGHAGTILSSTHRLDRLAPAAPALTPGQGPLGNGRSPSWALAAEPGSSLQCRVEPGGAGWAACGAPHVVDLGGVPDGPVLLRVRAVDAAGNVGAEATGGYVLDTSAGAVQLLSGPGDVGRRRAPEWRFASLDPDAALQCQVTHRGEVLTAWRTCAGAWTADLAGRPDGEVRFSVRTADGAGNTGTPAASAYVLDTTPPGAPEVRAAQARGSDRTPSWRFTAEAGAATMCRVQRRPAGVVEDWAPCGSPFTADLRGEPDGTYRLAVRATDRAGNEGPTGTGDVEVTPPEARPAPTASTGAAAARPEPAVGAGPGAPGASATAVPAAVAATAGATARETEPQRRRTAAGREAARPSGGRLAPARRTGDVPRTDAAGRDAGPADRPAQGPAGSARTPERRGVAKVAAAKVAGAVKDVAEPVVDAVATAAGAVVEHPDKSVFPLSLVLLVLTFLGVQGRIDRSDPKLASTPADAEPHLEFPPEPVA